MGDLAIYKDNEIEGKRVILEDAADVGTVTDIYVDSVDWRVTRFDVKLEKRYAERMGLETGLLKRTVIPVKIHMLKSVGDVVHLKGGLEELTRSQKTVFAETGSEKGDKKGKRDERPATNVPAGEPKKTPPKPPVKRKDEGKPRKL